MAADDRVVTVRGLGLRVREVRLRSRHRSAPVSSLVSAWRLLGSLYAAVGVLVISTTALPAASGGRESLVVRVLDAAAAAIALLLVAFARHLPRALLVPVIGSSTLLITGAVMASGGGSTAMAYACVYLVGPIYSRFVLPARSADAQLAFTVAVGAPALAAQPGVGAGEQVVLWGIAVVACGAVSWLVRALELAESDTQTGLPNRRGVERALGDALPRAGSGASLALVLLDLDHFRQVNDSLGRAGADQVIISTVDAWRAAVPSESVLGRVGGDSFALLLPGADVARATRVAEEMRTAVPFGCSVGVAGWEPRESASMLVARAEAAVYIAKRQGRGRTYAHPGGGSDGQELREALDAGEFVVHFQPIVDLAGGHLVGAEALVRWQRPGHGLVLPGDFLPEAERSGMIVDLGVHVLHEACRAAASWPPSATGAPLYLTVNASGLELQDARYAATVESALSASGLGADRLVLELVESDYDIESVHLVANLHRLRALGVSTAIDDFGTGYSSLDRLRRLGADILKIDRSFVSDIVEECDEAPVVRAVLAMASAMDLDVVAEGVETPAQAAWLRAHGCARGQGYLFGRPAAVLPGAGAAPATAAPLVPSPTSTAG